MNFKGTRGGSRWWAALLLAVATSFAVLAVAIATSDAVSAVDLTVARWVQGVDFPAWTGLLSLMGALTDKPVGPAVFVLLMVALWLRGLATEVIVLGFAQILFFPQLLVKHLVQRPRPTEDLISVTEIGEGFAFPSGHITLAVAVYGSAAIIALTRLEPGWRRNAVLGAAGTIVILSALSRPASGSHWPSDVLGGLLLGGFWLIMTTRLYHSMLRPGGPPRPLGSLLTLAETLLVEATPQRLMQRMRRA